MSVAVNCPTDVLGLVFAAVQPPSARKRLPEVCRHWRDAYDSSAVLWSEVRADFVRLSQGLLDRYGNLPCNPPPEHSRRIAYLAAWLARRAGVVRSLHIDWPSGCVETGEALPSLLQQPMPHLGSLAVLVQLSGREYNSTLRFGEVACLGSYQTQLTALTFGPLSRDTWGRACQNDVPADMAWLHSLPHLQRLKLPGFQVEQGTVAALGRLSRLMDLEVHIGSLEAQQSLQAVLQNLQVLTSLAATLARWPPAPLLNADQLLEQDQGELERLYPSLDVSSLPRLAALRLSRGGVLGLRSCLGLTWLELANSEFGMEELCGCSRLVGLHCLLYTFNACLEDYLDEDPDFEQAPPDCLPALRSLSLRATEYDRHAGHGLRPIIRNELSALTGLTSLHIEGEPFNVRDYMSDNDSAASDRIEDYALRMHQETEPSVVPPSRAFCLPHLRQLSLVSCGFEAVPDFVAGLPELHTLRLSGNIFRDTSSPSFFPGVPGPLCSTLQRLELRDCLLRSVPHFVSHLTALTALDLSANRSLDFSRSDVELLSRLTALRDLRLAKPPGLTREVVEWRQASVAALLGLQRACSWLDVQRALEPEGAEAA